MHCIVDIYFYYSQSVCDQKWKCKSKNILRNVRTVCLLLSTGYYVPALLQPPFYLLIPFLSLSVTISPPKTLNVPRSCPLS